MAQQVLGAKPDSLSLVSGTRMVEEVLLLQVVSDLCTYIVVCTHIQTDRRLGDRHPSWHLDDRQTDRQVNVKTV